MPNESEDKLREVKSSEPARSSTPLGPTDPAGPTGPQPHKGLPNWSKWLIGCLVAFVSAAVLLFSTCAYMIKNGF